MRNFIKTLLTDNPHLYLDEIRDRVRVAGHGHWSISTIHHVITHRSQLNWSLTKITFKAMQADPYEQLVYRAALSTIDDPAMLFFVDESSVGKKACRRRRGWSPRGTTATGLEFFTGTDATSGSTYTLIAAADINGFVETACQTVWRKRSSTDRNSARGTVDAAFFTEWVRTMLVPTLGLRVYSTPIISSNLAHHFSKGLHACLGRVTLT